MTSKIFIRTKTIHLLKNNAHYRKVIKNVFHVDGRGGGEGGPGEGEGEGEGKGGPGEGEGEGRHVTDRPA